MLKILQARLQRYMNRELPDVQAGLWKAQETAIKLPFSVGSQKTKRIPEKHLLLLYWYHRSLWLWGSQQTAKSWKRWKYQITLPAPWEISLQIKKQQLEQEMEQRTGSKLGKEYVKAVYCHPAYLNYMTSTSWESLGWRKHNGIKIARRNINNLRYVDDTTLMTESEEELKSLSMKVKEESEKVGLKLNIQKTKIMASGPITSWETDGETVETVSDFIFLGS